MEGIKYLDCSMMGSYYIDCEILEKNEDQYFIKYYDSCIEEEVTQWTTKDRLKFPKFADYII